MAHHPSASHSLEASELLDATEHASSSSFPPPGFASTSSAPLETSKKRRAPDEIAEKPKKKKKTKKHKSTAPGDEATSKDASGTSAISTEKPNGATSSTPTLPSAVPVAQLNLKPFANTQLLPRKSKSWTSLGPPTDTSAVANIAATPSQAHGRPDQQVQIAAATDDKKARKKEKKEKKRLKRLEREKSKASTSKAVKSKEQDAQKVPQSDSVPPSAASKDPAPKPTAHARKREKRRRRKEEHEREAGELKPEKKGSRPTTSASDESRTAADKKSRSTSLNDHSNQPVDHTIHQASRVRITNVQPNAKIQQDQSSDSSSEEGDDANAQEKSVTKLDLVKPQRQETEAKGQMKIGASHDIARPQPSVSVPVRRQELFRPLGGGRITTISVRSNVLNPLEQWNRSVRAAGGQDSDDSESESESESDSDNDQKISKKSAVKGSVHESFASKIFGHPEQDKEVARAVVVPKETSASAPGVAQKSPTSKSRRRVRFVDVTDPNADARIVGIEGQDPPHIETPPLPLPLLPGAANKWANIFPEIASAQRPHAASKAGPGEVLGMDELLRRKRRELRENKASQDTANPKTFPAFQTVVATDTPTPDEGILDLYADVDDATAEMMGEHIQAMDDRKPPQLQPTCNQSNEDVLVTLGNSNHTTEAVPHFDTGDASAVKASSQGGIHQEQGTPPGEGRDIVTPSRSRKFGRDGVEGPREQTPNPESSLLSERSKTPSRPDELDIVHPIVLIPKHVPESVSKSSPQVIAPKRKMTGASSKHFSSAKSTRSQTRQAQEPEVGSPDGMGTVDGQEAGPADTHTPSRRSRRVTAISKSEQKALVQDGAHQASTGEAAASLPPRRSSRHDVSPSRVNSPAPADSADEVTLIMPAPPQDTTTKVPRTPKTTPAKKTPVSRKSTGTVSLHFIDNRVDLYNSTGHSRRAPTGTSVVPAPSINESTFGIIQEEVWDQPFWLLVAVVLLNQTTGRAAVPAFKKLKERYETPENLAQAEHDDVFNMIQRLGLQNNRTKTLLNIAKQWSETPPQPAFLYRTKDYPAPGDGRASNTPKTVDEDVPICKGALEIGHLYGCGAYAFDSWRIFCRDVLRGVADDYKGTNAKEEGFEPEWKRVVPKDKELRACLRWMWLKEGWVWDPNDGSKRRADEEEMARAVKGEMEVGDQQEKAFAMRAAGGKSKRTASQLESPTPSKKAVPAALPAETKAPGKQSEIIVISDDEDEERSPVSIRTHSSDNIVVSQPTPALRLESSSKRRSAPLASRGKTRSSTQRQSITIADTPPSETPAGIVENLKERDVIDLEDSEEDSVIEVVSKRRRSGRLAL